MSIMNIHYEIELYYGICFHSKSDATKNTYVSNIIYSCFGIID